MSHCLEGRPGILVNEDEKRKGEKNAGLLALERMDEYCWHISAAGQTQCFNTLEDIMHQHVMYYKIVYCSSKWKPCRMLIRQS